MNISFVSLRSTRVHLQNSTFIFGKWSRKLQWYGRTKIPQNRRFERCLFTLRDPAPLMVYILQCFRTFLWPNADNSFGGENKFEYSRLLTANSKHQYEKQVIEAEVKVQSHVTLNKPVISIIYIVSHTWPLCSAQIVMDAVNSLESYFQKSTNISAIVQHMSVSFVSLRSSRVHLQNNTFILRKIVENLCDMAYQNTAKS